MFIDVVLMVLWVITTPVLIWSRWNGPVWLFMPILLVNVLAGVLGVMLNGDLTD